LIVTILTAMHDTGHERRSAADGDRSWDEYKLIQEKLDRIGDFRFRVRGWAITLVTGLIAAGLAKEIPAYVYIVAEVPVAAFI
jgi:hypothetical protein